MHGGELPELNYSCRAHHASFYASFPKDFQQLQQRWERFLALLDHRDGCRYKNKPYMIFSRGTERFMKWCSLLLGAFIVAFGPITGVVAAGLIYGNLLHFCLKASYAFPLLFKALAPQQLCTYFQQSPLSSTTASSLKQSNPRTVHLVQAHTILLG